MNSSTRDQRQARPLSEETQIKLSTTARKDLPAKDFAGPHRTFPIENKTHARDAISGAARSEHVGNISKAEEKHIDRKAESELGKGADHLREMHARK